MTSAELAVRRPVAQFIESYQSAMSKMQAGFEQALASYVELHALTNQEGKASEIDGYEIRNLRQLLTQRTNQSAWQRLLGWLGVEKTLSLERQRQMYRNLDKNPPELTMESVAELLAMLESADLGKESLREIFDLLRPGKSGRERLKTNQKAAWRVPRKVILENFVEAGWGRGFYIGYERLREVSAIDRAFYMLDGALDEFDEKAYRSPLADAIQSSKGAGETKYFKFQCYRNGNLHLTIKRADLLAELNRVGGTGTRALGMER